jgi:hypothetical protein
MNAVFTEVAQKLMPGIHRASQPSKAPQKGGWRCNEPFPTTRTSAFQYLAGRLAATVYHNNANNAKRGTER